MPPAAARPFRAGGRRASRVDPHGRSPAAPPALGEVLAGMMRQRGWQARLQRASVFSAWPRLVGPEVARHAVPLRVRGDVLVVATSHQAWAAQLSFLRTELVRRLRAECGDKLRDIVFEVQWDLLQSLRDPPSEPPAPPNAGALPRRADGAVDVGSAFAAWHLAAQRRRARLPGSERTRADV